MQRYRYFTFRFVRSDKDYGSDHEQTFKAVDYEHALKQAKKYASWRDSNGIQVYQLRGFVR